MTVVCVIVWKCFKVSKVFALSFPGYSHASLLGPHASYDYGSSTICLFISAIQDLSLYISIFLQKHYKLLILWTPGSRSQSSVLRVICGKWRTQTLHPEHKECLPANSCFSLLRNLWYCNSLHAHAWVCFWCIHLALMPHAISNVLVCVLMCNAWHWPPVLSHCVCEAVQFICVYGRVCVRACVYDWQVWASVCVCVCVCVCRVCACMHAMRGMPLMCMQLEVCSSLMHTHVTHIYICTDSWWNPTKQYRWMHHQSRGMTNHVKFVYKYGACLYGDIWVLEKLPCSLAHTTHAYDWKLVFLSSQRGLN